MALFGQLGEFVKGQEEWQQYAERMGHFLAANGVTTEECKRSIFLSVIGPKTYKLLCSLGVTKQARRQVLCRTGASAEKSLQLRAVRLWNATSFTLDSESQRSQ